MDFATKDSGARQEFASGMVRDTQAGKLRYDLAFDGPLIPTLVAELPKSAVALNFLAWYDAQGIKPNGVTWYTVSTACTVIRSIAEAEGGFVALLERYAALMTRGAAKYEARNWMKAAGAAEYERAVSSACRHFFQYYRGDTDEDHAAAVFFNLNLAEYVKMRLHNEPVI